MPTSPSAGLSPSCDCVFVVKLSALGDVIHALQALSFLGRMGVPVWWMTSRRYLPLVERVAFVERVFTPGDLPRLFLRFEQAFDLQGLLKSAVVARFVARRVVGFSFSSLREPLAGLLYTYRVKPEGAHVVEQLRSVVAKVLGVEDDGDFGVEIDLRGVELPFDVPRKFALLFPGAGWRTKNLSVDWCLRFLGLWHSHVDIPVFVVPGVGDSVRLHRLSPWLLPELGLLEAISLVSKSALVIAPDTGFLHAAAAMDVPALGLYCPSDPNRNGPFGGACRVVVCDRPCRGCFKRRCVSFCNDSISPELVVETALDLL